MNEKEELILLGQIKSDLESINRQLPHLRTADEKILLSQQKLSDRVGQLETVNARSKGFIAGATLVVTVIGSCFVAFFSSIRDHILTYIP